ncbi:hypothetical protein B0H19DRAFT_1274288 [Mycena capillaripes]|nr:hypothetical protein B0H19DRAFT_1274288 [Mycena capillaripes]
MNPCNTTFWALVVSSFLIFSFTPCSRQQRSTVYDLDVASCQLNSSDSEEFHLLFPPEQWFDQLINHGSSDKSTFAHRVQVNNVFYKPRGPLFIIQGAESSNMLCSGTFKLARWAPELAAALLSIGHRYFGMRRHFLWRSSS